MLGLATAAALLHGCGPGGDTQTTPCTQGARQCAPDGASVELCNLTNGSFETLEACGADEVCGDYQGTTACAPASCTPNKRFCHDGDVWDCTPAGEPSRVQADCAAGQLCVVDAGVAQCADVTCTPGQTRCAADGSGVQECTADGARFEPTQSCADGQVCQQNGSLTECVDDAVCTPGQRRCAADGSGVEACAADGSGFVTDQTCGAEETCTTPAGNPTCTSDVSCTPGERRCAPDGSRVEFCGSTGRGYVGGGDCDADETCGDFGGDILCAPTSCERNKRFCLSGDVWNCSAAGAPTGVQAECAAGQACIIDAGVSQCADVTCVPGELRCSDAGDGVQVCADDGTGFIPRTACGADQTCETIGDFSRCVDVLECQFGERRCVGAQQERCDASGTFVPDPCASDEVCAVVAGNPTCVDAVSCTPGERRCAPDGSRVEVCGPTGNRYVGFGNCDADETCGDFQGTIACAPTSCSANDRFCFEGDVWGCSAAGAPSRVQDECALGEACVVDAGVSQCAPVVCVPGSTRCSPAGDGIEVCGADGTGFVASTTCGADEVCALAGAIALCQPEAQCTTGTSRCAAAGGVERCNTAGLYDAATPCATGTVCVQDGARATCEQPVVCQPGERRCGASGARLEVCRADGTAFNPSTPCAQDESCTFINGAPTCAPASCPANTDFCAGGDIWSCDATGTPDALVTTCAPGEACVETSGAATCQQVVCTPGVTRCAQGDGSVEVCAADGTGYVTDAQCTGAEVCVDDFNAPRCEAPRVCAAGSLRCVTSGDAIEACAQDESGYLFDAACAAGELCVDDASGVRCASPQTCAPGETRCAADGGIEVCAPDGSGYVPDSSCPTGQACGTFGGDAQCAPSSCPANTLFCFEGDVWGCNPSGTPSSRAQSCGGNTDCVASNGQASCQSFTCTPGQTRCSPDGARVETCDPSGSTYLATALCQGTQACVDDASGTRCEAPRICTPGATRCSSGGDVEICSTDGTGFSTSTSCQGTQVCVDDASGTRCEAPQSCTPGETRCALDSGSIETCAPDGSGFMDTQMCAMTEACSDTGGAPQCTPAVSCSPGETECDANGDIVACNATGDGYVPASTCGLDLTCGVFDGTPQCVPDSCTLNRRFCFDDDVWNCDSQGRASGIQDDCDANETCGRLAGVTQCLPRECTPGELACGSASTVEYCEANGRFVPQTTCAADEACEEDGLSASCVPQPVCVQGATRCSAAGDAAEVCAPDRLSFDTAEACDPGETCQLLSGGAQCAPASCTRNQRFCHEGDVWSCNAQSLPNGVFDACGQSDQCLEVAGVFQCVTIVCQPGEQRCNAAGDAVEECDAIGSGFTTVQSCGGTEICSAGNGVGECVDGSVNCQTGFRYSGGQCVDIDECADGIAQCDAICQNTPGGFDCVSSVADMSSPYWQFSCPLGQQLSSPTGLEADCRCGTNQSLTGGLEPCWRPFEAYTRAPAFDFGQGPRPAAHPQVEIRGGVFDAAAREIIAAVDWSGSNDPDAGFVMAFDVDTRARRVVSGRHLSGGAPTTRGAGPAFADVRDVREGAGGLLYVLQGTLTRTEILSVDPSTGDRALVWERDGAGFGQCDNGRGSGSVQIRAEGFAIGAAGQFYLGFANTGSLGEGIGIVEVAADGSTCAFVTRSGSGAQNAYANQPVGSGPAFTSGELRGYAIQGGELYTLNNFDLRMVAVDLNTGARRVVSSANSTSPVGSGPQNSGGIGHRWATWDASRNVWWTTGRQGDTQIILVEPGSGDRHDLYCPGGSSSFAGAACVEGSLASGLSLNFGGSWLDPQDPDVVYFAHDSMGIVKYEVSTGNSLIWSL
jgi:hypothetical protein